ncbi:diguanylate cyclase domain-containing protein [Amphibiibacter pelophylacis]|uniref:GGDEF domain-containing protein n=1 Tax=Amphibiibacter pelophylacis TaxID=1799477 RepID=A0ACC6NZ15_9BURK
MPISRLLPPSPVHAWTRMLRRVVWLGAAGMKDVSAQRKILQTNVGALLGVAFVLIFMMAYLASGRPGVQQAAWMIAPGLGLFPLTLWLNHRRRHRLARHALLTVATALMLGLLFVQGTLISSHHYFLIFVLLGPLIFEYRHWRCMLAWTVLELALYAAASYGFFMPQPDFAADLTPELRHRLTALVDASMISGLFCVMVASEAASARNETTQQRLAETDTLTGAPNRRAFEAALDDRLALLRQPDPAGRLHGMALMLLDIDHFKRINDELGHDQGDVILRDVVQVLQQQVRRGDTLARIGGEEFALLLGHVSAREALASAQRLCDSVRGHPFRTRSGLRPVTISIGLVYFEAPLAPQDLYSLADQALYEAKHSGRDRVACARAPLGEADSLVI